MIDTNKKIILVGPAASGKDYMKALLTKQLNLKPSISHTTRPSRTGELEGLDYFFVDKPYFELMIKKNLFVEHQIFGSTEKHYYGTSKHTWENCNLFIMTPRGIADMMKYRNEMFIIYLNPSEEVRLQRMRQRNMFETPDTRLNRDKNDFRYFKDYDLMITNHDF